MVKLVKFILIKLIDENINPRIFLSKENLSSLIFVSFGMAIKARVPISVSMMDRKNLTNYDSS